MDLKQIHDQRADLLDALGLAFSGHLADARAKGESVQRRLLAMVNSIPRLAPGDPAHRLAGAISTSALALDEAAMSVTSTVNPEPSITEIAGAARINLPAADQTLTAVDAWALAPNGPCAGTKVVLAPFPLTFPSPDGTSAWLPH